MQLLNRALAGLSLAGLCLAAPIAGAADFPTKAITITNIYAVGGGTDLVAPRSGRR